MKHESFALYILRWIVLLAFVVLLSMNYWSSLLIEEDLKAIKAELALTKYQARKPEPSAKIPRKSNDDENTSEYPNLLSEDPFYGKTLPHLLGDNFTPQGILHNGIYARPNQLHPFAQFADVNAWRDQCLVSVSNMHFGKYETFAPALAHRAELRSNKEGEPEFWIFLRKDVYWAPLKPEFFDNSITLAPHFLQSHPVTAHDIKFYYDAFMNPHVQEGLAVTLRLYYQDIEEIKVIDDYTLVVRWNTKEFPSEDGAKIRKMKYMAKSWTLGLRPLPSFVFQYFPDGSKIINDESDPNVYITNPVWAQNFAQHWAKNVIVSCGSWLFNGFDEKYIRFKRNPQFFDPYATLVEEMEINFTSTSDALWDRFKIGQIDSFNLLPHQLAELDRFMKSAAYKEQAAHQNGIQTLNYVSRAFTYIGWNENKVFFKDKKVRQALTLAIDRQRIIDQLLNGMGSQITGPFLPSSSANDAKLNPYPYDPYKARQLLEEMGWFDSDGDGIIDKVIDGKTTPFQFSLTYYVKNPTSKAICEFVATSLKEIGIACHLNGVDIADLSASMDDRSFEAIFMGWALATPPEDPKQLWYSKDRNEKGSSNYVSFANLEADQIMDNLEFEDDPQKRIDLYHRFHRIIYDEQPYTFLYVPKYTFVYRERLQNVFLPIDRPDLVPGANVAEPQSSAFFLKT